MQTCTINKSHNIVISVPICMLNICSDFWFGHIAILILRVCDNIKISFISLPHRIERILCLDSGDGDLHYHHFDQSGQNFRHKRGQSDHVSEKSSENHSSQLRPVNRGPCGTRQHRFEDY